MLADGMSHAAIAKKLGCSTKSVQRVRREVEDKATCVGYEISMGEVRQLESSPNDH